MHRQAVHAGELIVVSAGTIHAIGAGLVIAEIQQRSDATFRLFDFGRDRELHPDGAVGAATAGPAPAQATSKRLSATRLVVATSPYFVLEQIDLAPRSHWEVVADREVWILWSRGRRASTGCTWPAVRRSSSTPSASECASAPGAVRGLMAYVGSEPVSDLLQSPSGELHERAVDPLTIRQRRSAGASAGGQPGGRRMSVRRIAFIGNSLPRRCGIATFTTDLQQAIAAAPGLHLDRGHHRR